LRGVFMVVIQKKNN